MAREPGFILPRLGKSTPMDNAAKATRIVGFTIKTLRRRGAIVGGVSAALEAQLRQAVAARLSWSVERWRREDRSPEGTREDQA